MKGQSLIIQFLLFFVIGLALFTTISGIFRLHSEVLRSDIAESSRELTASYISSIAISMASNCKDCNFTTYSLKLENTTANYMHILNLSSRGLRIFSEPEGGSSNVSIHLLNQTLTMGRAAFSTEPIILRFNNTGNKGELNLTREYRRT